MRRPVKDLDLAEQKIAKVEQNIRAVWISKRSSGSDPFRPWTRSLP
jgi:hypothetical protein